MLSKHDEIIDYVTKHSGINVTEMYDLSKLYLALLAEVNMYIFNICHFTTA